VTGSTVHDGAVGDVLAVMNEDGPEVDEAEKTVWVVATASQTRSCSAERRRWATRSGSDRPRRWNRSSRLSVVVVEVQVVHGVTGSTVHDGAVGDVLAVMNEDPIVNGAACHTMHHLYFNYNYGQFTTLWDRLGGSLLATYSPS
jgi:hypothetical protein